MYEVEPPDPSILNDHDSVETVFRNWHKTTEDPEKTWTVRDFFITFEGGTGREQGISDVSELVPDEWVVCPAGDDYTCDAIVFPDDSAYA